ncbi:MAG: 2-hydroxyglutaryl-CoA dehydratase [Anaerolineales bacterium]|nr:2-hydroxyglutaryl-CoA dehydratase [Anaerolineales bacterium]
MSRICALGLDAGSTTAKVVGVDAAGDLVWHHLEMAEPRVGDQVERFLELARQAGAPQGVPVVATGYGRKLVQGAARQVTEITCHARGIHRSLGHGGTLVDIGGQDSKVIKISPAGEVIDFVMSDKCAAGTGRFLENTAGRLGVALDEMGGYALSSDEEVSISSTCTVFAESEVISLIAHGTPIEPILRGLHRSLILRVVALVRSIGLAPPLMLSGGVARNPAVRQLLEEECGEPVILPRYPQLMGAYGAALIALNSKP